MSTIEKSWIILLLGMAGIWKAIPVGFIMSLGPFYIFTATAIGSCIAVLVIFLLSRKVKQFVLKKIANKKRASKKSEKFNRLMERYGPAGVGILGPLIFGPNATMALGMVFVKSEKKLLAWTLSGTVVWSAILTVVASFSIELFQMLQLF